MTEISDAPDDTTTPAPRDASEVGAAAARDAWAEAARPVLEEAAGRYRAVVTLTQLSTAVQESTGITTTQLMPQWIGDVLARVTDECQSRDEPLLSSLCVSAQGSVGQGYADAVEKARGERPEDPDGHAADERLACYRHWEAAGLPADGGTALRTSHITPTKKAAPRKAAAPRKSTAAAKPAKVAAPRRAGTREDAARTAAKASDGPEPTRVPLCPKCFTQVPASGICDYCD